MRKKEKKIEYQKGFDGVDIERTFADSFGQKQFRRLVCRKFV